MIKQLLQLNLGFPIESNKFVDPLLENLGYVRNHPEIYGSSCVARTCFSNKRNDFQIWVYLIFKQNPNRNHIFLDSLQKPRQKHRLPISGRSTSRCGTSTAAPLRGGFSGSWDTPTTSMYIICLVANYMQTIWYVNDMVHDMY